MYTSSKRDESVPPHTSWHVRSSLELSWRNQTTQEVLLYSGKDSDDDRHEAGGVSLLLSKHATKSPIDRVGTSVRPHRHCSICVPIPECVRCHVLATPRQTTQGKMIRTASMPSFSQLLIRYQEGTCSS